MIVATRFPTTNNTIWNPNIWNFSSIARLSLTGFWNRNEWGVFKATLIAAPSRFPNARPPSFPLLGRPTKAWVLRCSCQYSGEFERGHSWIRSIVRLVLSLLSVRLWTEREGVLRNAILHRDEHYFWLGFSFQSSEHWPGRRETMALKIQQGKKRTMEVRCATFGTALGSTAGRLPDLSNRVEHKEQFLFLLDFKLLLNEHGEWKQHSRLEFQLNCVPSFFENPVRFRFCRRRWDGTPMHQIANPQNRKTNSKNVNSWLKIRFEINHSCSLSCFWLNFCSKGAPLACSGASGMSDRCGVDLGVYRKLSWNDGSWNGIWVFHWIVLGFKLRNSSQTTNRSSDRKLEQRIHKRFGMFVRSVPASNSDLALANRSVRIRPFQSLVSKVKRFCSRWGSPVPFDPQSSFLPLSVLSLIFQGGEIFCGFWWFVSMFWLRAHFLTKDTTPALEYIELRSERQIEVIQLVRKTKSTEEGVNPLNLLAFEVDRTGLLVWWRRGRRRHVASLRVWSVWRVWICLFEKTLFLFNPSPKVPVRREASESQGS